MLTGFYTAASGMLMQQRTLNVLANNMANVKTPGFRTERVVSTTFEQALLTRMEGANSAVVGSGDPIRIVEDIPTSFDPGFLETTNRPFDMAIAGEGFFVVQSENQQYLTRNGNFDLDEEGYLVLRGAGRVMGQDGEIFLDGSSNFTVTREGVILDGEGRRIDTLLIAQPTNYAQLEKFANGMYIDPNADTTPYNGEGVQVVQNTLERSNADLNQEMARAIEAQRTFQICSSMLKTIDQINDKTANRIASL